jgi:hypothetical protein
MLEPWLNVACMENRSTDAGMLRCFGTRSVGTMPSNGDVVGSGANAGSGHRGR